MAYDLLITAVMPATGVQRAFLRNEAKSSAEVEMLFLTLLLRRSEVRFGCEADSEERENFLLAAGKYFQASWAEFEELRAQGLSAEEVPVALFVSRNAGVPSEGVGRLRRSGRKWQQILGQYNLSPDLLYVPLATGVPLAPVRSSREDREKVHEAWKSLPGLGSSAAFSDGAKTLSGGELTDADIVNLANLKLTSEMYRISPDKIVALRVAGWAFEAILAELAPRQTVYGSPDKSNPVRRAG